MKINSKLGESSRGVYMELGREVKLAKPGKQGERLEVQGLKMSRVIPRLPTWT